MNLVVLAAGSSSRYGRPKQLEPVGPSGELLLDYGIYDAVRSGFSQIVVVTRPEFESQLRKHIDSRFAGKLPIAYVSQTLETIPAGFSVPADRRKPWGTAHAILMAESVVDTPFAVCNADDYYGPHGYRALYDFLALASDASAHALIGYRLRDTLSPAGGVSRAICKRDEFGFVRHISEVIEIHRLGDTITGVSVDDQQIMLSGDEMVSMNLWGFNPDIFSVLNQGFEHFLRSCDTQPDAEFLIGTALNHSLASQRITLRSLATNDRWFGMTYPEDRQEAVTRIAELAKAGLYPLNLADGVADLCN